jgi:hypothetical protein
VTELLCYRIIGSNVGPKRKWGRAVAAARPRQARARMSGIKLPRATPAATPAGPKAGTPDTCRLTITIRGADYRARPVRNEAFAGAGRAWSLRKLGTNTRHHVVETIHRQTFDCGDHVWRHEGRETSCKHVRALRGRG